MSDLLARLEAFRAELDAVCKRHGFELSHESHGDFLARVGPHAHEGFNPTTIICEGTKDKGWPAMFATYEATEGWKLL